MCFLSPLFQESELLTFESLAQENFSRKIFRAEKKFCDGKISIVLSKISSERLSNPIRYPRFRVSASGVRQCTAFAFGVPLDINGFHPYT